MENKNDILDDFLNRINCQDLLKVDGGDDFIDRVMENIPSVSAEKQKLRGWVIVMRAVSSIAAVFFIALFFYLAADGGLNDDAPMSATYSKEADVYNPVPCADHNSTSMEFYDCYHRHKQELLKRRISFNH